MSWLNCCIQLKFFTKNTMHIRRFAPFFLKCSQTHVEAHHWHRIQEITSRTRLTEPRTISTAASCRPPAFSKVCAASTRKRPTCGAANFAQTTRHWVAKWEKFRWKVASTHCTRIFGTATPRPIHAAQCASHNTVQTRSRVAALSDRRVKGNCGLRI